MILSTLRSGDLSVLFIVLALIAFAVAIYLGYLGNWVGALVLALVGLIILLA